MPSATTHTKFSELIKKVLKSMDIYNSTDLTVSTDSTDQNTWGEIAGLCINQALHKIYDLIKDSRYLEDYPSTKISTIAGQDYAELAEEAFLDEIESITDTTNNQIKLTRKSWNWYRRNYPDPANSTGDPLYYIRRYERVYFAPRPSSSVVLTIDFRKFKGDLRLNGDLPLLPTHYDYWIIAESIPLIRKHIDDSFEIPLVIPERQIALESIFSGYDTIIQSGSNTEGESLKYYPYQRPIQ